jgi:hypothetical protein
MDRGTFGWISPPGAEYGHLKKTSQELRSRFGSLGTSGIDRQKYAQAVNRTVLRLVSDLKSLHRQDILDERITALPPLPEKLLVF